MEYVESTIVYYHQYCMDGFGALWSLYNSDEYKSNKASYTFIPVKAGYKFEQKDFAKDTNLVFLDISCTIEYAKNCVDNENVKSITIIDHHKIDVDGFISLQSNSNNKFMLVWDDKKSGCALSYLYYNSSDDENDVYIPKALRYIQDRDLWTWNLPNSKEANTALFDNTDLSQVTQDGICQALDKFSTLIKRAEYDINILIAEGKATLDFDEKCIKKICDTAARGVFYCGGREYIVYHVSTRLYRSEVGNKLCDMECDFAICWHYDVNSGMFWLSLRSGDKKQDVNEICKVFGGGGHRNASGCEMTPELFKKTLVTK